VLFGVVVVVDELELPTPVVLPLVPVDCPELVLPGALMSPVEFGFDVLEAAPVLLCGAVVVVVVVVVPGGVEVVVVALCPACPDVLSGVAVLLGGVALVLLCDASVPVVLVADEFCPDMLPVELCEASGMLVLVLLGDAVVDELLLGDADVLELVLLFGYWLAAFGSVAVPLFWVADD